MIDQNYVKSMDQWFAGLELELEQERNAVAFHEREIELHGKMIETMKERIKWDEERLAEAKEEFDNYINLNANGDHN